MTVKYSGNKNRVKLPLHPERMSVPITCKRKQKHAHKYYARCCCIRAMSIQLVQQHHAHDILFHTIFGHDIEAITEFVHASAVRLHAIVQCKFLASMMDSIIASKQRSADTVKVLFFLFLNVDIVLKEYVCNPGNKAAFAAAMNVRADCAGLDKLHAWSMVGTRQIAAAKARPFFKTLRDSLVKNWLQDERLNASDFLRMVKDEYLVA